MTGNLNLGRVMMRAKEFDQQIIKMQLTGLYVERAQQISEIFSVFIFLGGSIVLLGWVFDIPDLKSIYTGLAAMRPNTALCFVITGLALWCLGKKRMDKIRFRLTAALCVTVLLLIGLGTLCEYILKCDMGIDRILFKQAPVASLTASIARMSFNTAINFLLSGMALLIAVIKKTKLNIVMQCLVLIVGFSSFLSLIGYWYGAPSFYIGEKFSRVMALHTMVLFILTALGTLFLRPDSGLMSEITSDFTGGRIFRRLLPIAIIVPVGMGFLKLFAQKNLQLSNEFGVSLVAMGNISAILIYIYFLSVLLNRGEIKRKELELASNQFRESNEARQQALLDLSLKSELSSSEIANYSLETGIDQTHSKIGYIAFVNEDETVLTMQYWSKSAMAECSVINKPIVYAIKDTGLWGEAVRRREAVINNDYAAPHPAKKGTPAGHVKLTRHMNIPVFDKQKVVAVAGVGNKEADYTQSDVTALTLMMEGMWRLISHKRAEEALIAANQQLQANEQQLRASNQQLSANEQQLRAANQQLAATEQELRASKTILEEKIKDRTKELEESKSSLEVQVKEKTWDLHEKMASLERVNKIMIDRELRVIEIKKEVNQLCRELGKPELYGVS
ncbi:MAG: GAF domain-containing protein [Candidatus Omnitrophica bacterium]|nr:GAF domain-containing protein [Candidatus Omnitrophota bacterium]